MRAVVQRVSSANVLVNGEIISEISKGLLILLGIEDQDNDKDIKYIVEKCVGLRIFDDSAGKFNHPITEVGGEFLLVSQFTLLGDCRKGRRPSFSQAYPVEGAATVFQQVVAAFAATGLPVKTGKYRATMQVSSVNEGPVTLLLDSRKRI